MSPHGMGWRLQLAPRFRVVRIRRRLYRLELPADPLTDYEREVDDVLAVARTLGEPCLLVGHSSGGVVALEAAVRDPEAFAGLALYEPPVVIDQPVGGDALIIARAADTAGRPGKALSIFLRQMVGMSGLTPAGRISRPVRASGPEVRHANRLGNRLGAYALITIPVLVISGDRTPKSLVARTEALANMLPNGRRRVLRKQGHAANLRDPRQLAREIGGFAETVLPPARSPGSTN